MSEVAVFRVHNYSDLHWNLVGASVQVVRSLGILGEMCFVESQEMLVIARHTHIVRNLPNAVPVGNFEYTGNGGRILSPDQIFAC